MNTLAFPSLSTSLLTVAVTLWSPLAAQAADPRLQEAVLAETAEGDAKKALALYTTLARADDRDLARGAMLGQARLLRRLGRRDEAKALLETLAAAQGQGQKEAQRALGQGGEKGRIAELIESGRSSQEMKELVWFGEAAVPALIAAIEKLAGQPITIHRSGSGLPRELKSLTWALLRIGGQRVEAWLTTVVENGVPAARVAALYAVGKEIDPRLTTIATRLMDCDDVQVSRVALRGVGRYASADQLVRLLLDGRASQRVDAASNLVQHWSRFPNRVGAALAIVTAVESARLPPTESVRALIARIRDDSRFSDSPAARTARLRAWLLQPKEFKQFSFNRSTLVANENTDLLVRVTTQPGAGRFRNYIEAVLSSWTAESVDAVLQLSDQERLSPKALLRWWIEHAPRQRLPDLLRRMDRLGAAQNRSSWRRLEAMMKTPESGEIEALAEAASKLTVHDPSSINGVIALAIAVDSDQSGAILLELAGRGGVFSGQVGSFAQSSASRRLLAMTVPVLAQASVDARERESVLKEILRRQPGLLLGKLDGIADLGDAVSYTHLVQDPRIGMPEGLDQLVEEGLRRKPKLFSALLGVDQNDYVVTWPRVADVVYPHALERDPTKFLARWVSNQPKTAAKADFYGAAFAKTKWGQMLVAEVPTDATAQHIKPLMARLGDHPDEVASIGRILLQVKSDLSVGERGQLIRALTREVVDGRSSGTAAATLAGFDSSAVVIALNQAAATGHASEYVILSAWSATSAPELAPLLSRLQSSSREDVRKQAHEALRILDAAAHRRREASRHRALSTLIEQAKKPGKAQMRAIRALGHLTAPEAALALVELAGNDNEAVARLAEDVLSR